MRRSLRHAPNRAHSSKLIRSCSIPRLRRQGPERPWCKREPPLLVLAPCSHARRESNVWEPVGSRVPPWWRRGVAKCDVESADRDETPSPVASSPARGAWAIGAASLRWGRREAHTGIGTGRFRQDHTRRGVGEQPCAGGFVGGMAVTRRTRQRSGRVLVVCRRFLADGETGRRGGRQRAPRRG